MFYERGKLDDLLTAAFSSEPTPDLARITDSRSPEFLNRVRSTADLILEQIGDEPELLRMVEDDLFDHPDDDYGIAEHLAVKLALSKAIIRQIDTPVKIGVVVPVYHETNRLKRRSGTQEDSDWRTDQDPHPNGENFVYQKYEQLKWLTAENPNITFHVSYVDDACDHGSGRVIDELLTVNGYRERNSTLYLDQAIEGRNRGISDLRTDAISDFQTANDSQKAGAVYLGLADSLMSGDDITVYTDGDLSYDLGQIGLLVEPILKGENNYTVANRRDRRAYTEDAVYSHIHPPEKRGMKATLGSLRNALLAGHIPPDTQPGFKAFRTSVLEPLLRKPGKVHDFSFDIQLLARLSQYAGPAGSVGVACIDSPDETTADGDATYHRMARAYLEVASELGIENPPIVHILQALAGVPTKNPRYVWENMSRLMGGHVHSELNSAALAPSIARIRQYFDVPTNNTASSLPLTDQIIEDMTQIVDAIIASEPN